MALPIDLQEIPGAAELDSWFGYWPSFHDAEVTSLHLNRKGNSTLRVHTWEMTKQVDEKGYYVLDKHVEVEFVFEGPSDLSLSGFNHQNVIFELGIAKTHSGFRLTLAECYGLSGSIEAKTLSLNITPGKPSR
jgi:hypothetical protein